jgi:hypothetical protein
MTYCVGWKFGGTVYLLADSALTDVPATNAVSTFGQLHAEVEGKQVEESTLKLFEIAPGVAVTYAGDVYRALQIIGFIRDNYGESISPAELFACVENSMGPFGDTRRVAIILACAPSNGLTTLTYWSTTEGIKTDRDYYAIGSLETYHRPFTEQRLIDFAVKQKTDAMSLLPLMTGLVQSYGIYDNLINQGVGGVIFGLRATAGRVKWQGDTIYLVYDSEFRNVQFICASVRRSKPNDVLSVYSSFIGSTRRFAFGFTSKSSEEGASSAASINWRFCICIRLPDRRLTVIGRKDLSIPSRYVRLSVLNQGIHIEIDPDLAADLIRPITVSGDIAYAFRLIIE